MIRESSDARSMDFSSLDKSIVSLFTLRVNCIHRSGMII